MLNQPLRQLSVLLAVLPIGASVAASLTLSRPAFAQSALQPPAQTATATTTQPLTQPLRLEIRLSQRRVTLYQGDTKVKSYPIAVGRPGWETPKGSYKVQQKIQKPTWIHPLTGEVIKGGDPENPLGNFWIGFWTDGKDWIGFHGTPTPKSVGTAASHGCIRMYNKDVAELFSKIPLGTEVTVRE